MANRFRNNSTEIKPTRYYSSKQENGVAKALNAKVTPNSGATDWKKGDLETEDFLLECKTKVKDSESISIKKEWLEKLKQESLFMGKKYEALIFSFGPGQENYYVISEELFKELTGL